ncbi:NUDIX hydrolase [Alkalibacillus haloalkaliphilus]|uniref:DNA mismatch repair protein MutT n=1 Tax=Alkalibacillus haloalkaliphilus TaxID=94136 RepID=A0A511W525_9BACI|nr:NUDIX hydrolase [Alkalibacillus haloalkaliphilus]GEN46180.1 DNA mismatch repair protein MutT [Alkalibacillus haloalkaliphilus]
MDAVFKTEEGIFNYRVAGVLIHNDCVLLHKDKEDDFWALPGGRVEVTEEASKAVGREFKEEIGVDIQVEKLLWSAENFFTYRESSYHEIGFYFKVKESDNGLPQQEVFYGKEGEKDLIYKWVRLDQLKDYSVQPEFIKEELKELNSSSKHIVVHD